MILHLLEVWALVAAAFAAGCGLGWVLYRYLDNTDYAFEQRDLAEAIHRRLRGLPPAGSAIAARSAIGVPGRDLILADADVGAPVVPVGPAVRRSLAETFRARVAARAAAHAAAANPGSGNPDSANPDAVMALRQRVQGSALAAAWSDAHQRRNGALPPDSVEGGDGRVIEVGEILPPLRPGVAASEAPGPSPPALIEADDEAAAHIAAALLRPVSDSSAKVDARLESALAPGDRLIASPPEALMLPAPAAHEIAAPAATPGLEQTPQPLLGIDLSDEIGRALRRDLQLPEVVVAEPPATLTAVAAASIAVSGANGEVAFDWAAEEPQPALATGAGGVERPPAGQALQIAISVTAALTAPVPPLEPDASRAFIEPSPDLPLPSVIAFGREQPVAANRPGSDRERHDARDGLSRLPSAGDRRRRKADAGSRARADNVGTRPPIASPDEPRDDLTRIRGIGRANAARLNELGIMRLAQIAAWGDAEQRWVSAYLGFTGRVEREGWSAQARALEAAAEAAE